MLSHYKFTNSKCYVCGNAFLPLIAGNQQCPSVEAQDPVWQEVS